MRDHPSIIRYARSFARTTGMDLDDLLQEARVGYLRAVRADEAGQYDPRIASFDTYATNAVFRHMCKVHGRCRRGEGELLGEDLARSWSEEGDATFEETIADESTPAPDRYLILSELVRELPDDARAVVDLVLGDLPAEVIDPVLAGVKGASRRLREYVRAALGLRRGDRAEAAFDAIGEMLGSI
jgi:hypothetical protein